MSRRVLPTIVILLLLSWGSLHSEPATVVQETSLRPTPNAQKFLAFLTPDTAVDLVEKKDGWVKVRIEGWVREDAVRAVASDVVSATPAVPPPTPVPIPPPPKSAPPAAVAASGVRLVGQIDVPMSRRVKRDNTVAGITVILLPASVAFESGIADELGSIEVSLADIERATEKAMQQSNFTQAVQDRNELHKQRDDLLAQRRNLVKADHASHEQSARQQALSTTVADANGWFRLDGVESGSYSVYARMNTNDFDLEWSESLRVGNAPAEITLDSQAATGIQPASKKK